MRLGETKDQWRNLLNMRAEDEEYRFFDRNRSEEFWLTRHVQRYRMPRRRKSKIIMGGMDVSGRKKE